MAGDRKVFRQSASPDGAWILRVMPPTEAAPSFYAIFSRHQPRETTGFPFGYATSESSLAIRWDLPNDVCGLFLGDACYGMFYYGLRERTIKRSRARHDPSKPFNDEAIAWFTQEHIIRSEPWEGLYPLRTMTLDRCPWCRRKAEECSVAIYRGAVGSSKIQIEPVCRDCSRWATAFIRLRKRGFRRKEALSELGIV